MVRRSSILSVPLVWLLLLAGAVCAAPAVALAPSPTGHAVARLEPVVWSKVYAPTGGCDVWNCSATGRDGSLYVAGTRNANAADSEVIVARYRLSGDRRWLRRLDLPNHQEAVALVVDSVGNAYVLASTIAATSGENVLLLKYSSGGTLLWKAVYSGRGKNADRGNGLCLDAAGNAYVAGYTWKGSRDFDLLVQKYRPGGTRAWTYVWDDGANAMDWAMGVAVDSQKRCYVSGFVRGPAGRSGVVARLTSDGHLDWQDAPPFSGTGGVECRDIAVRGDTVAVTAIVSDAYGDDVWLATYSTEGARGWIALSNRDEFDNPAALAFDNDGSVIVCGSTGNAYGDAVPDSRGYIFEYSPAATPQVNDTFWSEGDNGDAWFTDLALSGDGTVYCLGAITTAGDTDALLVQYSGAGSRLRSVAIDRAPAGGVDRFESAALGTSSGGAIVLYGVGWTEDAKGNANALAVRLTP